VLDVAVVLKRLCLFAIAFSSAIGWSTDSYTPLVLE
jgi:hypothetical protein